MGKDHANNKNVLVEALHEKTKIEDIEEDCASYQRRSICRAIATIVQELSVERIMAQFVGEYLPMSSVV
ncbi:MAG: hypothetical protein LBS40_02400 [Burkholderiales bacterium]|nr:hypothetical protein [Burkholderiales bacterium]